MKTLLLFLTAIFLFAGCYNDNREELYPEDLSQCDTSGTRFANDILPIFNLHCNLSGCHNSSDRRGGYVLDNYQGALNTVHSGRLLGSINFENGFLRMPENAPKLSTCNINKITAWINNGAPDN